MTIDIGGINWYYIDRGSGPAIVLVHGNTGSSAWFDRVMDIPGFRCVAPDLPNFGRSSPLPGPITIDAYAEALSLFIRTAGLKDAVLVGHSLGGSVCQALVARHPELVRALVLVDSGAPSGLKTPVDRHPAIEMMRTNPQVLAMALRAVVPTLADEAYFARLVADAALMATPAWIGNAVALGEMDLRGKLGDFNKPVLVIHGGKDVIITAAMAEETRAAFPDARLIELPEIGHSVTVEVPERFVALLREFVEGLKG
jgi:branched-chain amino acid transport system permease protein